MEHCSTEPQTLTDIIGKLTELEMVGYIMYSPKLKKRILLTNEMYNELDKEELELHQSRYQLVMQAMDVVKDFLSEEGNLNLSDVIETLQLGEDAGNLEPFNHHVSD